MRNPSGIFETVFAETGDKATPPFSESGGWPSQYSVPVTSGGAAPERETENYLMNQLFAICVDANIYGAALPWSDVLNYQAAAVVTGTNGRLYISTVLNTNIDPVTDATGTWEWIPTSDDLASESGILGSDLIGFSGQTVTDALNARPTSSALASITRGSEGLRLVGGVDVSAFFLLPVAICRAGSGGGLLFNRNFSGVNNPGVGLYDATLNFSMAGAYCAVLTSTGGTNPSVTSYNPNVIGYQIRVPNGNLTNAECTIVVYGDVP